MPTHTARDVIVAALSTPLPCPTCGRVETCRCATRPGHTLIEERAALIEAALLQHGIIPTPSAEPTQEDVNEAAMVLAARSRHPRYTLTTDGWRKLLQATADVRLAATTAEQHAVGAGAREEIASLREGLLAWHDAQDDRRASPAGG